MVIFMAVGPLFGLVIFLTLGIGALWAVVSAIKQLWSKYHK